MRRLLILVLCVVVGATGCGRSSASKSKSKSPDSTVVKRKPRTTPQASGFARTLVPSYIEDLASSDVRQRRSAAQNLSNMGKEAKTALPALEKALKDQDAQVRADAKKAIDSIKSDLGG